MSVSLLTLKRFSLFLLGLLFLSPNVFAQGEPQPFRAPEEYTGNVQPIVQPQPVATSPSFAYSQQDIGTVQQQNPQPVYVTPKAQDKLPGDDNKIKLSTISGLDLGVGLSHYTYREPSLSVKLSGVKYGFNGAVTGTLPRDFFWAGDVRYATGDSDYSGSGKNPNRPEDLWDARVLAGRDFALTSYGRSFDLSPYLGFGYRSFSSDDRGITSTGAHGYRRANDLYYLPLGVKPRFRATPNARISSTFEFDYMITGQQTTRLSDVNPGYPDIKNTQNSGRGFRGDVMWETKTWAAGPFLSYWNINQSDTKCATGTMFIVCGDEPHNHTLEYGVQFKYHLF